MTNVRFSLLIALLLGVFLSSPAQSAKFYKWVDDEGVTHYGEAPPNTDMATVVNVKSGASSDQQKSIDNLDAMRRAKEASLKASEKDPRQVEAEAKNREIMKRNCEIQKKNLAQLNISGRIKEASADGEIRYLSTEEIDNRKKEIGKYIQENCSEM